MEKEQLRKANDLIVKIKSTNDAIGIFKRPRKIRCVQISTHQEGCRDIYMNTLYRDNSLHSSDGIHDDIFLHQVGMLTKRYIEDMIDLLKNQLDSLEKQLKPYNYHLMIDAKKKFNYNDRGRN